MIGDNLNWFFELGILVGIKRKYPDCTNAELERISEAEFLMHEDGIDHDECVLKAIPADELREALDALREGLSQ